MRMDLYPDSSVHMKYPTMKHYREANMNDGLNKATSMIIPISGETAVTEDKRFMVDVPSAHFIMM